MTYNGPSSGPHRTCAGCRTVAPQSTLVRFAATCSGVAAGRCLPGRGAWLCRRTECADLALARGGLARALRVDRSEIDAGAIHDAVRAPGGSSNSQDPKPCGPGDVTPVP